MIHSWNKRFFRGNRKKVAARRKARTSFKRRERLRLGVRRR
jgi:hypothetical protein